MPAEQDFDSIAVAIQNTADDGNRLDGLAALRRLKAELLAAQERAEKAEYDALMANKVVEANSVARWQSVETKKAQRVEAELAVAQEREKALREALEPFASALLTDAQIKRGSIMWRVPTNWIIAAKAAFRD